MGDKELIKQTISFVWMTFGWLSLLPLPSVFFY